MDNGSLYFYLLIIFGFVFYIKYMEQKPGKEEKLPYKKREELMTRAEKEFFDVLERVVNNCYYIVPQVKISSIVAVPNIKNYYHYLNKIDRKTIDFVLFDKKSFSPIMAIELDDSSHDKEERMKRDKFIDAVMNTVGLKITHIKVGPIYNQEEIKKHIFLD